MDLQLINKGLDYTRKRKRWVLLLAALGFSGYGAYRVYHSPSLVKKRRRLLKLLGVLFSIAEVVSDSAEMIGVVSKDLKEFLQSDADRIPNSLRQVSKITRSEEFSESVIRVTTALTLGIMRGYRFDSRNNDGMSDNSSFSNQLLDKLFSSAGSGFASVVVGSFARNLVMAIYSDGQCSGRSLDVNNSNSADNNVTESQSVPEWVNVLCGEKCREFMGDCIQMFVSTAVAVYLDKTMDMNTYDEFFSGLTNPKHESKMRDMMGSVCNGAVETLVKTSHQVLTSPSLNVSNSSSSSSVLAIDHFQSLTTSIEQEQSSTERIARKSFDENEDRTARKLFDENEDNGWVSKMSSTLAVPSNRRFVLDVTGKVTFETVRSFLEFLVEKLSDGLERSVNVVHELKLLRKSFALSSDLQDSFLKLRLGGYDCV
ncbi:hypothetical protein F0562_006253 [Nyssa sinensis]|uniref:Protein PHLOEM PROTEIN 2-LIKE A10 n=1 Tax=Nyssa sinensis TaxID=561372 RepID=A0A5J5AML3_9ASTE|nr:hypothetical protein F0562_006253 [Nyssa sinensis]